MLGELAATRRHPKPVREMTVRETFQFWAPTNGTRRGRVSGTSDAD